MLDVKLRQQLLSRGVCWQRIPLIADIAKLDRSIGRQITIDADLASA
jgi:hypothetical protein